MTRYEECVERIEDFRKLENGWFDGAGVAIASNAIINARTLIELLKTEEDLSVYPNPAGYVQIEYYSEPDNRDYEIEVYDWNININSYEATRDVNIRNEDGSAAYKDEISEKINYFEKIRQENDFVSVWSIFEVEDINSKHFLNSGSRMRIYYEGAALDIEGKTWLDVWRIADELIKMSGDFHHIFIEKIEKSNFKNYELITGS